MSVYLLVSYVNVQYLLMSTVIKPNKRRIRWRLVEFGSNFVKVSKIAEMKRSHGEDPAQGEGSAGAGAKKYKTGLPDETAQSALTTNNNLETDGSVESGSAVEPGPGYLTNFSEATPHQSPVVQNEGASTSAGSSNMQPNSIPDVAAVMELDDEDSGFMPNEDMYNTLIIVVDGHVLRDNLPAVVGVLDSETVTPLRILIPFVVLERMGYFRDDRAHQTYLDRRYYEANSFIGAALNTRDEKVILQTPSDAYIPGIFGNHEHAKIIACCRQVLRRYQNMVLLTDDPDLRLRALHYGINVCPSSEIWARVVF